MAADWNEIFNQISPNANEREIETKFVVPLIKDLGYDSDEYCFQFKTGLGTNAVDFAVRSNAGRGDKFHDSMTEPFLLIEAKKPSEDISKPSHINQLMSYLSHVNCHLARFGILTNSVQIQLYRSHGRVVHPLTKVLPLRDSKAEETLAKIKGLVKTSAKALTICVYNNKGGVGKTTTAVNLAATLGIIGFKRKDFVFNNNSKKNVLALDFDAQRDMTKSLFREPAAKKLRGLSFSYEGCNILSKDKVPLTECLDKNISLCEAIYSYKVKSKKSGANAKVSEVPLFDVVPSNDEFKRYGEDDWKEKVHFSKLRELLAELRDKYDYIVIDCPPQVSFFSRSGLYAADVLLIPVKHSDLASLHNAAKVITEIIPQMNELRKEAELTALPVFYNDEEKDIRNDEKFRGREQEMFANELDFIVKSYGENYDLKRYFKKITAETVVIPSSATISSHSFERLPAAYKSMKVLNWYADLVKHYFLRPAKEPELNQETDVIPKKSEKVQAGIDADKVRTIRSTLYKDGKIDRKEAEALFKLNKQVSGADNDPSWKILFVEALTEHFLKDEASPGAVDEDEAAYIIDKIKADGIDGAELDLLVNIAINAKSCHESFNAFVLEALRASVLADGVIDDSEAEMLRKVIYSAVGDKGVNQAHADFLFDINDSVSGAANSPKWQKLFVTTVSEYLIKDRTSPGKIDGKKAEWLIGRIGSDGKFDENEKALLSHIKASAKEIHPKLQFLLDFFGYKFGYK